MLAGDPLRVIERERSCSNGKGHSRVENLARSLSGIDRNRDCRRKLFCDGGLLGLGALRYRRDG